MCSLAEKAGAILLFALRFQTIICHKILDTTLLLRHGLTLSTQVLATTQETHDISWGKFGKDHLAVFSQPTLLI